MSLQKLLTSFRKESTESLEEVIAHANDLRGHLATEAFVLLFVAALSESQLAAWSQGLLAHKPLMSYAGIIENMRGTFGADMLAKREIAVGRQAYAIADTNGECAYCHRNGHNILQCYKLRNNQQSHDNGNPPRGSRGNARSGGRRGGGGGHGGGRGMADAHRRIAASVYMSHRKMFTTSSCMGYLEAHT